MTMLFVTCKFERPPSASGGSFSNLTCALFLPAVGLQILFLAASSIPFDCIGTIYLSGSQAPLLPTSMTTRDSLDEKEFDISPHLLVIDVDPMEERLSGDTY
ncbi:BZ3500_MvSof-1268-A1-R1_Chr2-3g05369 [Microbotryum saponariae]|uniref:BZ3500_MvSof-1268-A1-R1_Chr2-3g05369 protein n=1 Tax=Microbotryum saponariae TaxID=289078 RepID=A0A2X0KP95_9BASI|nr:BZ3500_MvSof-1268-A1-R1_Chr2-3g05369 [Microbotryum saponariae]SDA01297.1 BZ3501_MvSof-1269-A2-R1_Chr2-2g05042 [Microbotryum saponariae]